VHRHDLKPTVARLSRLFTKAPVSAPETTAVAVAAE
jgi:acetyl-CoA carboxylase carboxyl transferase subunit beta